MHKWGINPNPGCGDSNQNINHIIRECPKRKFNRKLGNILNATPEAEWIHNLHIIL